MCSYALEQEDLPLSCPGFPSVQSLMSTSFLSPSLLAAVFVHVIGMMEQERKPMGEEEKVQVIRGSCSTLLQLAEGESYLPCSL